MWRMAWPGLRRSEEIGSPGLSGSAFMRPHPHPNPSLEGRGGSSGKVARLHAPASALPRWITVPQPIEGQIIALS